MKTLDMADKYDPLSYQDEYTEGAPDSTPTIRVHIPKFAPQVFLEAENDDFDLHGERDTIPCPPPYPHPYERTGINVGAWAILLATIGFWAAVAYLIFG